MSQRTVRRRLARSWRRLAELSIPATWCPAVSLNERVRPRAQEWFGLDTSRKPFQPLTKRLGALVASGLSHQARRRRGRLPGSAKKRHSRRELWAEIQAHLFQREFLLRSAARLESDGVA